MESLPDPGALSAWGLFATAFIIGLSGAVMPGPVLAVTITHAARRGAMAGPLIVLGHGILEAALLIALVAGLGPFLSRPWVSGLIGGAGALILFWMGWGMLRSLPKLSLDLDKGAQKTAGPVRDGILLSLANPYWSLWWATVGLSLTAMAMDAGLGLWGLLIFYLGHISSDFVWFTSIGVLVAKGKRFFTTRMHRGLVGVCAVFIMLFALFFAWFAFGRLTA